MKRRLIVAMTVIAMLAMGAAGCTQAEQPAEPAPESVAESSAPEVAEPVSEAEPEPPAEEPAAESAEETPASRALSEWEGLWNSLDTYLDDPGLAAAYETLAGREQKTADDILAGFQERYKSEIVSMEIKGDTVSFYSAVQGAAAEGEALAQATYTYTGEMPTEMGFSWHRFDGPADAAYPVLLLIDVGEDKPGETMRHFHFRYGTDADALFAMEDWYPTMVKSDSEIQLIANDFTIEES